MPKRRTSLTKRLNRLERVSRPEVKIGADESGAFDTVGSVNGTLLRPQQLQQGTDSHMRIGDKVKSRNIRFQAILKMPYSSSSATCAVRLLVLRSKFSNPSTSDMPSWYGTVDEDKFFVIKDILTNVSNQYWNTSSGANDGSTIKKIKFNLPTGMRKLQFNGVGLQSPMNNEYVIYLLAENQNAEVAYNHQHYYVDN